MVKKRIKNKNIIVLSGVDTSDNITALKYIKDHYPKFKKVCYLPAEADDSEDEIKQAKKDFKRYAKTTGFDFGLLENEKTSAIKAKIKKSDILFLGGGNTFSFFDQIQKHKLLAEFKRHLQSGKLIVGLSAGGIVLSPSLMMACFPSKDADECSLQRKSFKSLGLLSFEVCPHYKSSKNMIKDLLTYSSLHSPLLYGIKDGDFVAVGDRGLYFSNKTALFYRGERISLG